MPKTETVLSLFLASPGDLKDERQKVEEIVGDVNRIISVTHSTRIHLLNWEKSTFPSVGLYPQDVINNQIGDYDIFVGLMWVRFGSPTDLYGSGTEEEFRRAKARKDSGEDVEIMFYFKDEGPPLSKLDLNQLSKVQEFKNSLGEEGVYYWSFSNISVFERDFRDHLFKKVISYSALDKKNVSINKPRIENNEIERGLLDINEEIESELPNLISIINKFAELTQSMGEKVGGHAAKIADMNAVGGFSSSQMKSVINEAASDIEKYSESISSLSEEFSKLFNNIYKGYVESFAIAKSDFYVSDEIKEFVDSGIELRHTMAETRDQLINMLNQARNLPRMTSRLNYAKKKMTEEVNKIALEIDDAVKRFDEVLGIN